MEIALFIPQDIEFPIREGLRKQVWLQAKELKKRGYKIKIYCTYKDKYNFKRKKRVEIKDGIEIIRGNIFNISFFKTDILHIFSAPTPDLYFVVNFAKYKKSFITITDGELSKFWESKLSAFMVKIINKKIDRIFIQTDYQRKIAEKYFKFWKIKKIEPLIEDIDYVGEKNKNPTILFMSHFSKYKGVFEVINAYKNLVKKYPDLKLVLADSGLGEDRKEVLEEIKGVSNIELKGVVDNIEELSRAWIYIYPIQKAHNTFSVPISLYEALQCETIFISKDIGGISEYFGNEFLINANNELEKKIEYILENYNEYLEKVNGIKLIDNKKVIEDYLEYYNQKEKIGFVTLLDGIRPHFVHKAFGEGVNADFINDKFYSNRNIFINLINTFFVGLNILNKYDKLILNGATGVYIANIIKCFSIKRTEIIYLDASTTFYKICEDKENMRSKILYKLLKSVDRYITVSGLNKSYIKELFKDKKVDIVNPFFKIEKFKNNVNINKKDKNLFCYIGQLREEKNIINIIKSFIKFNKRYKETKLVIVGFGELEKKVKKLIKNNENIRFLGKVNFRDISSILEKSYYILQMAKYDPHPVSILEAMYMKVIPLISNKVGERDIVNKKLIHSSDLYDIVNISKYIEKIYLSSEKEKQEIIKENYNEVKKYTKKIKTEEFKRVVVEDENYKKNRIF
ncbi:glycosyltransferase [Haliovirga abyssi]|uniref:Glycosyl transferase family 1 domain-containing protein n=1 Tax=Haliovirga abyssi TaxID=2996794 RepID=A0AAU9E3S2_9FUSO|nr:glycosyltransferase [Haliovirga abyssi]BDU51120.1 hypothetical protein HLVA_16890 [Haliovirga abyssi]